MPNVRASPSRAAAAAGRAKLLNGLERSANNNKEKKKLPVESVVSETADDSFLSALKDQLPKKAPKRLFRRNSHKFQPEIPSGIFDAPPASTSGSSLEASPSNEGGFLENKVEGGRKKLFRRRSRFQPEIPSAIFDGDHICTSTPFKKAAASSDAINVSCISPVPQSEDASKEVIQSKESLRKSVENDDG